MSGGTPTYFVPDAKDNFNGDVSRFQTLGIGAIYTPHEVSLAGYKNIIMGENADAIAYINAGERVMLTTFADGGAIGTSDDPVRILANGAAVCAAAANGNGNAYIDFVEPSLDDLEVGMKTSSLGEMRAKELHVRSVVGLNQTDDGIRADLVNILATGRVDLTSKNNYFGQFRGGAFLTGGPKADFQVSAHAGTRFRTWLADGLRGSARLTNLDGGAIDFHTRLGDSPAADWKSEGFFESDWLVSRISRVEADVMHHLDRPVTLDRGPVFFTTEDLVSFYQGGASGLEEGSGFRNATADEIEFVEEEA